MQQPIAIDRPLTPPWPHRGPMASAAQRAPMSAYLASNDCLNALITYWDLTENQGPSDSSSALLRAYVCSLRAEGKFKSLDDAYQLRDQAIARYGNPAHAAFHELLSENLKSLEARYPGDRELSEGAENYVFTRDRDVLTWTAYRPFRHGLLVGLLDGYRYQACEHEGWRNSPAAFLCEQIQYRLLKQLESRDCPGGGLWASYCKGELDLPSKQLAA